MSRALIDLACYAIAIGFVVLLFLAASGAPDGLVCGVKCGL
ncbi:MAG TPA: hypothetical protein VGS60_17590 [Actinomycetes bacterium]|nr:hypothetical protein [Actinomycetes bacterium]